MKKVLYFFSLLLFCYTSNGQFRGLIVNEFSQGNGGQREYIELLVVGTRTCTETTADLRGWIIDDQNGWYGDGPNNSNAPGHIRFAFNPTWEAVPIGSIIVIYNPADKNTSLPATDIIDPANFKYIVAVNGSNNGVLFQQNSVEPFNVDVLGVNLGTGPGYKYPAPSDASYTATTGSTWEYSIAINNFSGSSIGDVLNIVKPTKTDSAFFSINHGYPIRTAPFRQAHVVIPGVQVGNVAFLTSEKYTDASSWAVGAVLVNESPGEPNGGANNDWINSMRINPKPPTVTIDAPQACEGQNATLTANPMPATGSYSYTWSVPSNVPPSIPRPLNVPSFQTSFAGTYELTITDNITGCYASATTVVSFKQRPERPVLLAKPQFCSQPTPTIANIQISGTDIKWYNTLSATAVLPTSTPVVFKSYFATQTVDGCESERLTVNVDVKPSPTVEIFSRAYCEGTSTEILLKGTRGATVTYTANGVPGPDVLIESDGFGRIDPGTVTGDITYNLTGIKTADCTGSVNLTAVVKYVEKPKNLPDTFVFCDYPRPTIADADRKIGGNYNWYYLNSPTPSTPTTNLVEVFYWIAKTDPTGFCETTRERVFADIKYANEPYSSDQTFCSGNNPTVADLKPLYPNLTLAWYETINSDYTKPLPLSQPLSSKTYFARGTNGECFSEKISPFNITVNSSPPAPDAFVSRQPTCSSSTGTITIISPSKAAGITYKIQKASFFVTSDDPIFTNVAPGTYDITYTINGGCSSVVSTVTVDNVPTSTLTATATASPISCGQSSGVITVNASNGVGQYSYSINNGITYQQSNTFSNLAAGSHTIKVRDNTGCTFDVTATITQNNSTITATATATPISCGQSTGTITITASNGATPYTYSINNGTSYQTGNVFSNLSAGSYIIRVKDNNACTFDVSATITQNTSAITATATATQISCGQSTGTITVNASNGVEPFTYSINNGTSYQQSNIFSNLAAGSYSIRVKDNSGCTYDVTATINQNSAAITATATASQIPCGQSTGTITVNAFNGNAPYNYSINNGTSYQLSNTFSNLSAGSYSIRVRDNSGCTFDLTVTITQNNSTVTATAAATDTECGKSNGSITAGGSGSSTYTYSLNSGSFGTSNVFNNLAAGTYKITVQNGSGCSDDTVVVIKTITSAVTQSSSMSGCKSVIFNGVTYTSSTTVRDTVRNTLGCDSIYRTTNINVQNTPAITRNITITGCDSVVYNYVTYRNSGIVRDTFKTSLGCDSIYVVTTVNISTFNLVLTASANPAFAGTMVTLSTNSGTGYRTIAWQPAHLFPFQTSSTQQIKADTSRTIKVIGESNAGCIDTAQLYIEAKEFTDFFIPNAFTPNGDGKNDVFLLMGTTINKGRVRIFNQWGEMLFATEDIRKGWDGNYKGKQQPVGIYVYEVHVTMNNGTEIKRKGFINLIR